MNMGENQIAKRASGKQKTGDLKSPVAVASCESF
jgi:hypothetical protein